MTYQEQLRAVIEDKQETLAIIRRLKRKIDVTRLDAKAEGHRRKHDFDEMLALVEVLERKTRGVK